MSAVSEVIERPTAPLAATPTAEIDQMAETGPPCHDAPPGVELEIVDGYLVDAETGEIHGHANAAGDFHITTQAAAEWLLQKIMEHQAAIKAINAKQAAILENIDRERKREVDRLDWLERRFESELVAF